MSTPARIALIFPSLLLLSYLVAAVIADAAGFIVLVVGMLTLVPLVLRRSGEYDDNSEVGPIVDEHEAST